MFGERMGCMMRAAARQYFGFIVEWCTGEAIKAKWPTQKMTETPRAGCARAAYASECVSRAPPQSMARLLLCSVRNSNTTKLSSHSAAHTATRFNLGDGKIPNAHATRLAYCQCPA